MGKGWWRGMSLPTTVTVTVETEKPPTGESSRDFPKSSTARGAKWLWVALRLRLTGAGARLCSARHRPDVQGGARFQHWMDSECHLSRRECVWGQRGKGPTNQAKGQCLQGRGV